MRIPRVILVALAVIGLLIPTLGFGDSLPAPLEKKLPPGVATVTYAGQIFRITTPSALIVRWDPVSATQIRVRVSAYGGAGLPSVEPAAPASTLNIYWVNYSTDVYDGAVPPNGQFIDAVLSTEGGFVDR